jgi:hypothetical protein
MLLGGDFDRLPRIIEELAEAQSRSEARLDQLAGVVGDLTRAQSSLTSRVEDLTQAVRRLTIVVESHDGDLLEDRFRRRAPSYFGPILRRPRLVEAEDLELVDAARESGALAEADFRQLLLLDAIVRGGDVREPGKPDTLLAVEVSATIDTEDVERAVERAAILVNLGYRALPAVGGKAISDRAEALAAAKGVYIRRAELTHNGH